MIDMETVRFIDFLNRMAEKSQNGFIPFSKATHADVEDSILYDDESPDGKHPDCYPVVGQTVIDPEHHDIVDYMSDRFLNEEIGIYVRYDSDCDDYYMYVELPNELDPSSLGCAEIIVEDGHWYIA